MNVILLLLLWIKPGGKSYNGKQPILDIQPAALHERSPFFAGSRLMIEQLKQFVDITLN
ncbi:MAG: hypothetical protein WDO19_27460 [Bacteroidota bacterium]